MCYLRLNKNHSEDCEEFLVCVHEFLSFFILWYTFILRFSHNHFELTIEKQFILHLSSTNIGFFHFQVVLHIHVTFTVNNNCYEDCEELLVHLCIIIDPFLFWYTFSFQVFYSDIYFLFVQSILSSVSNFNWVFICFLFTVQEQSWWRLWRTNWKYLNLVQYHHMRLESWKYIREVKVQLTCTHDHICR